MHLPSHASSGLPGRPPIPALDAAVVQTLGRLEFSGHEPVLRAFALGCASRTAGDGASEAVMEMLAACKAMADDPEEAAQVRERYSGAASAAFVVGVRRGLPSAARFTAAYQALGPDAWRAAHGAAEMELFYALLTDAASLGRVRQRQIDWLARAGALN